ncbi:putative Golgi transport protein Sly1 [Taphrina deformans PYCC 5710]|uniref:Golgi transport protein Sly1 n=1 Tax=Taphrina deformans (strain PYCC 5710 / ATCC 11124 / CBS 356.35 / IMI 108563 / JCM 9778 / NBRC 8474) TaxID=1097556 RepID=R4XFK0_TAPDE|nr:putative Golgi transport protein Sly1 [Taphrina deformans PYCC 5710]|eukprot:CCG83257.1 putative Golgi transport protein Sly1 [Taphrina deformans PYCC 5710]
MSSSLRDLQISSIKRLLSLHSDSKATVENSIWKVLIFDSLGQDVISSVLRVNDLREAGVTVHMQLKADRQPIADVPAVYFVEPTPENIQRIADDLTKGLYDSAYLNFSSSIPRTLLEDLAALTATNGVAGNIKQVYDQSLNFVVSEPDLFSLRQKDVFHMLNAPSVAEAAVESAIEKMVTGLFSVVVTLDNIPIIRCPGGNAAEMVARKLDSRLRDYVLNSRQNYSASQSTHYQRPVLVILDRTIDLVSMVSHSWTYQALVHDLCELSLNRVTLTDADEKKKSYDLDTHDFFWASNANTVFPSVAENIQVELDRFTREKAEITRKTGITDIDDLDPAKAGTTLHLHAALKALPEMQARKSTLDMHMTIATAVLKGVQERSIDKFVESEETIARIPKAQLLAAIKDSERQPQDKMRLFLIYYLSVEEIKKLEMQEYENALTEAGCDLSPLSAVKKVRELTRMSIVTAPVVVQQNTAQDQLFRGFSSLKNTLGARMQEAGIAENFNTLITGVKNFLPSSSNLTVTRIVESLMNPESSQSYTSQTSLTEDYLYFDPRAKNAQKPVRPPSFNEAVVFMVGGGNYVEYGNLLDWVERQKVAGRTKRIVYGASEIVSPTQFVEELSRSQ